MIHFYWRLRARYSRWATRHNPRPSTEEILRRIGARCGDPQCEQEGDCMGHLTASPATKEDT